MSHPDSLCTEITVNIGNSTITGIAFFTDIGTDNRFTRGIFHYTRNGLFLLLDHLHEGHFLQQMLPKDVLQ